MKNVLGRQAPGGTPEGARSCRCWKQIVIEEKINLRKYLWFNYISTFLETFRFLHWRFLLYMYIYG